MQTGKLIMMNFASLLVVKSLHAVIQPLEKNLPLNKLRTRNSKMKATYKSSMTGNQTLRNSDKPMNRALKVQAKITVLALLKST